MTGKILEFPKMVKLTVAFSPFEDGEEVLENCQCCLDFHGARLIEFGAWGDDDEVGPWFCTFKCFERDVELLVEKPRVPFPSPGRDQLRRQDERLGIESPRIFVDGKP